MRDGNDHERAKSRRGNDGGPRSTRTTAAGTSASGSCARPDQAAGPASRRATGNAAKAIAGAPPTDLRLLLAHQPKSALAADGLGFHLQLSGHTHGGQYFPFTLLLKAALRFYTGLQRVGAMWVYINAGTTYWGPPFRLGADQEITLIELARA